MKINVMILVLWVGFIFTMGVATGKETTSLGEATNRGDRVVIEKYIDKENDVVCYWNKRHPADIECVQIRGLKQYNRDAK